MYNKIFNNNTNNLRGGPTRFDQLGVTLRRASHYGQARNTFSSFPLRVLPIPASRPMASGHFMCMAPPPTEVAPVGVDGGARGRSSEGTGGDVGHGCA